MAGRNGAVEPGFSVPSDRGHGDSPRGGLAYTRASSCIAVLPVRSAIDSAGRERVGQSVSEPARRLTVMSHLAVWTIPAIVLAVNSFWWLPGVWLASTKGESGFAFFHPEGVGRRLVQIIVSESPVECLLLAVGLPGLVLLLQRDRALGWALSGFCDAGIFWGYFAGGSRALDFLQPGRQTYAFFTALAVAGGAGIDELRRRAARSVSTESTTLIDG